MPGVWPAIFIEHMSSYLETKQRFIDNLNRDALAHGAGRYSEIGKGFDDLDGDLPRNQGPEFEKLFVALNFWDGWIDARNHEWRHYKGIEESDWPRLAMEITKSLSEDSEITDPLVLLHFDLRKKDQSKGPLKRLVERLMK